MRRILLSVLLGLLLPSVAGAQSSLRVSVPEENFRAAPKGTKIALLLKDAVLRGGETQGDWVQATLEGWIPAKDVRSEDRDGFTLAAARETALLSAPEGSTTARALAGLLLEEVERRSGWVRVRRTGWVWRGSVAEVAGSASPPQATAATAAPATDSVAAPPEPETPPLVMLASPGGDTLSVLPGDARVEVVGREGAWTRVRVEGWTLQKPMGAEAAGQEVSLNALRHDAERFRGRKVSWDAQFISMQRADSLRRDFTRGEVYLLARQPNGEHGFIYLVVPAAQLSAAKGLQPLQRFRFTARVRQGRSLQMGHPVLEIIEILP